jgi:methyl-accepting chemotaxis protein
MADTLPATLSTQALDSPGRPGRWQLSLRANFFLIVLMVAGFGVFVIMAMDDMYRTVERLYRHPFTVSQTVAAIETNVVRLHDAVKDLLLVRSAPELARIEREMATIDASLQQQLDLVAERFLGNPEDVVRIRQRLQEWRDIRRDEIQMVTRGEIEQAREFILRGKGMAASLVVTEQVDVVRQFARAKADEFYQSSSEANARYRILVVTVLAICILLIAGFTWSMRRNLVTVANTLTSSATDIATTLVEEERIANRQGVAVNETFTTMEELGSSSRQSAEQAEAAADVARRVLELAERGESHVDRVLHTMSQTQNRVDAIAKQILWLTEQTSQIREITGMMTDFANETKILAMNTAVEAARAGEHGKGFAVLSAETRKLAEESKLAARRIDALVNDIQKASTATVMATDEGTQSAAASIEVAGNTVETFRAVASSMGEVSQNSQQISLNIRQQSVAVRQVVEAMNSLNMGARESVAGIEQTKQRLQTLRTLAHQLERLLG